MVRVPKMDLEVHCYKNENCIYQHENYPFNCGHSHHNLDSTKPYDKKLRMYKACSRKILFQVDCNRIFESDEIDRPSGTRPVQWIDLPMSLKVNSCLIN